MPAMECIQNKNYEDLNNKHELFSGDRQDSMKTFFNFELCCISTVRWDLIHTRIEFVLNSFGKQFSFRDNIFLYLYIFNSNQDTLMVCFYRGLPKWLCPISGHKT